MRDFVGRVPDSYRLTDRALSYSTSTLGTEVRATFSQFCRPVADAPLEGNLPRERQRPATAAGTRRGPWRPENKRSRNHK